MTVVEEPGVGACCALGVKYCLIGQAHGAQSHAKVESHVLVVLQECVVECGIVCPIATIGPVDRHDDNGIRIGAILANVVNPALNVCTEGLDVGAWERTLLLQDDMTPSLAANQHLGARITVLGNAVAFIPMGAERLAKQGVLGPGGVLAHSCCNGVEHCILVVVVDETVVEREHLDLLR